MKRKPFPLLLLLLIVIIAVVNGFASVYSWYFFVPWLDMPMHFFGGAWIAGVALWLYLGAQRSAHGEVPSTSRVYLVSILSVLAIGIFWEIFEFGLDRVVEFTRVYNTADTLSDLFFGVFGAAVVTYVILARHHSKKLKTSDKS